MKKIQAELIKTDDGIFIALYFPYNQEIISLIRTLSRAHWDPHRKCWLICQSNGPLEKLNYRFKGNLYFESKQDQKYYIADNEFTLTKIPEEYLKVLAMKKYSDRTIQVYTSMFRKFMDHFRGRKPEEITDEEIREYLLLLNTVEKRSDTYLNQIINAIKFYYEKVMQREVQTYYLQRPRGSRRLPEILSMDEVALILKCSGNLKHRCILYLIYSGGLRLGEVTRLTISDVDSGRKMLKIRQAKGRKDRYTLLSEKALKLLREYFREYRPKKWLFEGIDGGQYSERSVQEIFYRAIRQTGIIKHASVHTLRHSFATHLLEQGTDVTYIQELLGHRNIKTTLIYSHVTRRGIDGIKSPLDNLNI